jgi:uncharacterized protein
MRLRLFGIISLALAQAAHAQSFNCRYARTPDEIAICENGRLSRLDERLSGRFFRLRDSLYGPDRARLDREQAAWLNARQQCGSDPGCIAAAYRTRIAELSGW